MATDFATWEEEIDGDTRLVVVRGEIDIFTAPEFKDVVARALEGGHRRVVIDLCQATFLDSSSLGILISAHRQQELQNGLLVVVCDVAPILKVFAVTGLDAVLPIVRSREQATGRLTPAR